MRVIISLLLLSATGLSQEDWNEKISKPISQVRVPFGIHVTSGFGPAVVGEPGLGAATIVGEGRASAFVLDESEQDFGILNLRNQGDWHDGGMQRVAFYGNGNGKPILDLSGYSLYLRDIFIRGDLRGKKVPHTGLKISGGQHYVLDNVQAELLDGVGIHLDRVMFARLSSCNGEGCNVGLLLTGSRGMIEIDQFYAEQSKVGIRSEGVTFNLRGGVFVSKRHKTNAVELIGCAGCNVDMSQGVGRVYLDSASTGNNVVVSTGDLVRVIDKGYGNAVRTLTTPALSSEHFESSMADFTPEESDDRLYRVVSRLPMAANSSYSIEYVYSTSKQANLYAEFYDLRERKHYDFATQSWGDRPSTQQLPWVTGQQCRQEVLVDAGERDRLIQVRFLASRAGGSQVRLFQLRTVQVE